VKFKGTYTNAPMGEGKEKIMGWEELCQHSEKGDRERSLIEGKAELGKSLTEKKVEFFQHLNNVMANKLIKPSIIMEYVNQYNISMGDK